MKTCQPYAERVRELEAEGLTTSDAQGCADAERSGPGVIAALKLWRDVSPYFDPWGLAGPQHGRRRAEIAGLLTGERVPVKAAGVTAITAYLVALSGAAGDCQAERERGLATWARSQLSRGKL